MCLKSLPEIPPECGRGITGQSGNRNPFNFSTENRKMSVLKKLMQARVDLQATSLKKTGKNEYSGNSYFELEDFLPAIQLIFHKLGLCGLVRYTGELATLTITDTDDNSEVIVTSPMSEAALKGCHPVQNLGAVESYLRRYLWTTALEIVEHDALDQMTGDTDGVQQTPNGKTKPKASPKTQPEPTVSATDSPPAEVGEIAFIKAKFKALKETSVSDILTEAGIDRLLGEDYKEMTKAEFVAIKTTLKGKK
jgi:hypothetical protein